MKSWQGVFGANRLILVVLLQLSDITVLGFLTRNPERQLYDELTRTYDEGTRPVLRANSTITVNFSITLQQIVDLDERNQNLITQVWLFEEWTDEILSWDAKKYNGIEAMILPAERIWTPDLYIFNNAEKGSEGFVVVNDSRASVQSDGSVAWVVPLMIKSSCAVDVTYFPFDNQHCDVRFGSWAYDGKQVDLVKKVEDIDMSEFSTNNEYTLMDIRLDREIKFYEIFSGSYPQIVMRLHMRRKPTFYAYTVIAPTLVLCMMTLFTFLLPCDNGDKVGIGLTVFLSLYVLQLAIAESIPDSNSLPLIGVFMTLVMTLNSISLLFATLVINIKKKGERKPCPEVPRFLLLFCKKFLAKVTCTRLLTYFDLYDMCELEGDTVTPYMASRGGNETSPFSMEHLELADFAAASTSDTSATIQRMRRRHRSSMEGLVFHRINGQELSHGGNAPRDLRLEWCFVAQVLDKTLFIVFLLASLMSIFIPLVIIPAMHRYD